MNRQHAFFDELSKIAEEQERAFVTKERLIRALKAGLATAGGFGLGWGTGNLIADTILPRSLDRLVPHPTAKQLQTGMLIAGGLQTMGSLALDDMRARARRYIAEGDPVPQGSPPMNVGGLHE